MAFAEVTCFDESWSIHCASLARGVTNMTDFPLICLILGDKPTEAFIVNVSDDQSIMALKELIKKAIHPRLNHVVVSSLKLWKVDLSSEDPVENFVPDGQPLHPFEKLQMFKNGPENHIRVIVKAPASQEARGGLLVNCVSSGLMSLM